MWPRVLTLSAARCAASLLSWVGRGREIEEEGQLYKPWRWLSVMVTTRIAPGRICLVTKNSLRMGNALLPLRPGIFGKRHLRDCPYPQHHHLTGP